MGDLTRRATAGAPQGFGMHSGPDEDVDALTFNVTATTFRDLGLPSPELRQGVLASGVHTERRRVRRRSDGTHFRRAIAWSATRTRILIHRMEQPVAPRGDGRFEAQGRWVKAASVLREAAQPAAVRRGDVKHAPQTGNDDGGSPGAAERFARAYEDLTVLPRPVRSSVLSRAVDPDHFYTALLHHGSGDSARHSLNLVRVTPREGIVVVAVRPKAAPAWQVSQYTYDFAAPDAPEGGVATSDRHHLA